MSAMDTKQAGGARRPSYTAVNFPCTADKGGYHPAPGCRDSTEESEMTREDNDTKRTKQKASPGQGDKQRRRRA
eukprot:1644908-Rhodomonas_salina.2